MGKNDVSVRQKGSKEHKEHISPVAKVVELTKCSTDDAEFALHENDNDVDQAVIAILERPDVNVWKEHKRKQQKKVEKEVPSQNFRNKGPRGSDSRHTDSERRGLRESRGPRPSQPGQNQENRPFRQKDRSDFHSSRGGFGSRGGGSYRQNNRDVGADQQKNKDFPEVDSFSAMALNDEDTNWKNGPLVFEPTVPPLNPAIDSSTSIANVSDATPAVTMYATEVVTSSTTVVKTEKLSFAAVAAAKSKKQQQPPPPVSAQQQQPSKQLSVASPQQHIPQGIPESSQMNSSSDNNAFVSVNSQIMSGSPSNPLQLSQNFPDDVGKDLSTSGLGGSSSYVPTSNSFMNVNQEFTDKLKNDIGLHSTAVSTNPLNSYSAVAHSSPGGGTSALLQSSAGNQLLMNTNTSSSTLNFGNSMNSQPSLHSGVEFLTGDTTSKGTVDIQFGFNTSNSSNASNVMDRLQHQQQKTAQNQNSKHREPSSLSYAETHSVDYQSNDIRNNVDQQQHGDSNSISSALINSGKMNGGSQLSSNTGSQSQQQSAAGQHSAQHSQGGLTQPPTTQPFQQHQSQQQHQQVQPQQQLTNQPPQSQHSLHQQQQQIYTAAQFSSYGFPYLYSPVTNVREMEQFTALAAPFPYMNQLDMQLGAMLPPSMAANTGPTAPATATASAGNPPSAGGANNMNSALSSSQNHHQQLTQQGNQASQLQQQQHRSSAADNKFSSQLQSGGNAASNGLPSLSGNIPFQNIGSANSQQPSVHQSRGQSSGALNSGMLNTSSSTGNNVAPPPGFTAPHFVPQPGLQSLFQVPSYGHPQMPFPLLFPGNAAQQQQSQQRQQPPQGHHNQQQHLMQSQNHHQSQQRHGGGGGALNMEHAPFIDMVKYPQQNSGTGSNSNLQGLSNAPYHGSSGSFGLNSSNQSQQQLHRNQSINQGTTEW